MKSRGNEVASFGTSDIGSWWRNYSTPREEKSRGERGSDSVEVLREEMGVDRSSHTCASEFRYLGYRKLENQKLGIASSKVASSEIPQGKVSELTDHRVSGIREPNAQPLNS